MRNYLQPGVDGKGRSPQEQAMDLKSTGFRIFLI